MPTAPYPIPLSRERRAPHGQGIALSILACLPFWALALAVLA